MSKTRDTGNIGNIVKVDASGNVSFVSGSTTLATINTSGQLSGSSPVLSSSYASNAETLDGLDSTVFTLTSSFNAQTASFTAFTASILSQTASFNAFSASQNSFTASILAQTASMNAFSASINTATSSFSTRVGALESYTASQTLRNTTYATTASNNFINTQHIADTTNPTGFDTTASLYTEGGLGIKKDSYFSSSLYIKGNLTVYGTQSVSYITSSQLNISTNLITVNTSTPSVRFGGIAVQDSGSTSGLTGSLLWDSQNNSWLYNNPSGSGNYDSAMVIMGPRNSSALGSEVGLNCNYLVQGHGHHHTTSSAIFHDGSTTCLPGAIVGTGTACFSNTVQATSKVFIQRSAGGADTLIQFKNEVGTDKAKILFGGTNEELSFYAGTGATENMRITNTGVACFAGTVCAPRFLWSSGATESFLTTGGSNTAIGNGGTAGLALYSSNNPRLTISATGESTFTCRVCVSGLSTDASIALNSSAPLSFSGTGGYIYMYSRRAGGSCGGILINNGTGNNMWFGEVGAHVYGFSTGGIGTDYTGTPLLNLDVNTQRIGIGTSTPDSKLEICSTNTSSELLATFRTAIDANGEFTSIRVGNGNKYAYVGTLLNGADVAYFHTACNPFTNSCGIYLDQSGRVGMGFCQPVARLELLPPGGATSAGCFASSTINIWDPTSIGSHSQITFGYGGGRNWAASYIGHVSTNSWSGGYGDLVFGTRNCGNDIQPTEKLRITSNNSIVGYSQLYSTYTKATCTPDGGSQTARYIEDALGQWIQVGRFISNASIAIGNTWSSVRGLSTSLAQDAATEFSADWGNSCPTEVRIMGATDFCRWRETRTVDFIYKNIPGRSWSTFFNGGCDNGTYLTLGTPRYGFNTCGTYDGFGRWSNPFNCMIGMSDGAYTNPSPAYAAPTASAFNWFTAQDAKLTAIHSGIYSGQDATETTGFGYDDSVRGFVDAYPNFASNMSGGDQLPASAVWILLKFN